MPDDTEYLYHSRWLRVAWNGVVAFGFGFDPSQMIVGLYLGPWSVFIGDCGA